jgi:hypothetical protein
MKLSEDEISALVRPLPSVRRLSSMQECISTEAVLSQIADRGTARWILAYLLGHVDFISHGCMADYAERECTHESWNAACSALRATLRCNGGDTQATCDQMLHELRTMHGLE